MSEENQTNQSGLDGQNQMNLSRSADAPAAADNVGQDNLNPDDNSNTDNSGLDNNGQENTDDNGVYGAPDSYDFKDVKLPEGYTIDDALAAKFAPIGKKLNLSQQSANELASLLVEVQQGQLQTAPDKIAEIKRQEQEATRLNYEKMLNTDAEIGGGDKAKMNAYLDVADVGYNSFASKELKTVISQLGLDYHPAVIKHFYRLGKLCGNDKITKTGSQVQELSAAQILYGNSTKSEDN